MNVTGRQWEMLMSRTAKLVCLVSLGINVLGFATFVVMEQTVQISERVLSRLDIEVPRFQESRLSDLNYHSVTTRTVSVHGIAGFEQSNNSFNRLGHASLEFRPALKKLGSHTAGVRIRFKTDSSRLHLPLVGLKPVSFSYPYLSEQATSGIDLYIDSRYALTLTGHDTKEAINISDSSGSKQMRLVEIYLPSFSPAELREIGVEPGTLVEAAPEFKSSVVFYGTSITQGASAPRPGLTFPAIISRKLGTEFYNYGFAGNGRGDPEIARVLAEIDADIYVLEYSRQAPGTENAVSENLIEFCRIIKAKRPEAAIVIVTALYDITEARGYEQLEAGRRAFRVAFDQLRRQHSNVQLVEGFSLLGPDNHDHLADGTHPNALGMAGVAEGLLPILQPVLVRDEIR